MDKGDEAGDAAVAAEHALEAAAATAAPPLGFVFGAYFDGLPALRCDMTAEQKKDGALTVLTERELRERESRGNDEELQMSDWW